MVDTSATPSRSHRQIAEALLHAGVRCLQLRAKDLDDATLGQQLEELLPLVREFDARLILNDRMELASRFPGVGLHLGQDDASPEEARRLLGPGAWIGWSTHTLDQVAEAQALPIDYIGFGPVFCGEGKHLSSGDLRTASNPVGTELLARAVRRSSLPVVAIGGINEDNLDSVVDAGAGAVAMISAVTRASDMRAAARRIHRKVERGSGK